MVILILKGNIPFKWSRHHIQKIILVKKFCCNLPYRFKACDHKTVLISKPSNLSHHITTLGIGGANSPFLRLFLNQLEQYSVNLSVNVLSHYASVTSTPTSLFQNTSRYTYGWALKVGNLFWDVIVQIWLGNITRAGLELQAKILEA